MTSKGKVYAQPNGRVTRHEKVRYKKQSHRAGHETEY